MEASEKYANKATASTIVVIMGLAIIAGSRFSFLANMGKIAPTTLASMTVKYKLMHTVRAISISIFQYSVYV